MNPKHILFPTDFSEESLRPLEQAPELFENRKVTLVHVVQSVPIMATSAPFAPPLEDPSVVASRMESAEKMDELAGVLGAASEVDTQVLTASDAGKETAECADRIGADLIVLSTHGRTGFRRLLLGSVAESVLRHAACPVLTFPARKGQQLGAPALPEGHH
ncbi:MAG: universal stress protein [Planctomycetota bacterium]